MSEANNELSFETALARLEEIATQIQKSDVGLEKSLELFKEGGELAAKASALLENAKLSIQEYQKGAQ